MLSKDQSKNKNKIRAIIKYYLSGVKVTKIASGLPVGGDLEYADELTLGQALEKRHILEENKLSEKQKTSSGTVAGQFRRRFQSWVEGSQHVAVMLQL